MRIKLIKAFLFIGFLSILNTELFSQYTSKDNFTGAWDMPESWNPAWVSPQTIINGLDITIYGYITLYQSLTLSGITDKLIVNDTLVIIGDLSISNQCVLTINNNGILIVKGNLIMNNKSGIIADGYLVVTGDFKKSGSLSDGSFTSNDNPEKVFIGGTVTPSNITANNLNFPALNCAAPTVTTYPNSSCSYGTMTDLANDPIWSFFQNTCTITTPVISLSGPLTFCSGGSVTLTSSPGTTYLWSTGETTSSINVTVEGSYYVVVTDSKKCRSTKSSTADVKINSLPPAPIITASGPTTFCEGGSVNLTSSSGNSYLWSTGATSQSINVTSSGSYSVKVVSSKGCQSAASVATIVTVNALPAIPVITASGPTNICSGGSVTLTSSNAKSYLWSTGETTSGINVNISGSFNVSVTDANGCQSGVSASATVNVNDLPVVYAGADVTIPNGTSTTINATVTGTGPFTYSWSPSGQLVNPSIEDPTTVNLAATTLYKLTATSATNSCSSSGSVTISVSGGPLGSAPAANPSTICSGATVQLYALATGGSGTYTYSWSSTPAGFSSIIGDPVVNPVVTTTFNLAVFDGFTTANSQVLVTVNAAPVTPVISVGGPTVFCDGGNVNLNSSAGTSYLWSTGATTQGINVTATGNYTVIVTNANGCKSAVSAATDVTVNPIPVTPTITSGGPTTFCDGGSVTLTSSTGAGYLWSAGATSQSINVTVAGNYSVSLVSSNGCQSAVSVPTIVTVYSLPGTPAITSNSPTTFCAGKNVTLTSTAGANFLWSTGETTQSINVNTPGTYAVQIFNGSGCQSAMSAATAVTVNPIPVTPTITSGGPTTFCDGGSVTLTSSTGAGYLWSTGATSQSINVTVEGNYSVSLVSSNGCQSAVSVPTIVTVYSLPGTPAITSNSPTTFCAGKNVTLTSTAGANFLWSTGETTQSINVNTPGTYTVKIFNGSGCQSSVSAGTVVSINPLPVVSITSSSTICANDILTLTGNPSGGTFAVIDGPGSISGNILTPTGSGEINLEYVYSDVCTNTARQSVIVGAKPVAYAGPDQVLKYVFRTIMEGTLSGTETGEWAIISGSGKISDIHSPNTAVTDLSVGDNTFLWTVKNGSCESDDEIIITVYDLFVPSVITPNGDNKNDFFKVTEIGSRAELTIFNRWGDLEYSSINYLNDWDGRNMKGIELPNDTYFYVIKFENGITRKGTILITR